MSIAPNEDLHNLEERVRQAEMHDDLLEAVEVFEEIEKRGWMKPDHYVQMGKHLVKLRRKQDARQAWIRAYQMDASSPAVQLLDENFPGWKKSIPAPQPAKPAAPPRPAARPAAAPRSQPAHQPQFAQSQPAQRPSQPAQLVQASYAESAINWDYVLEDVAEARTLGQSNSMEGAEL